MERTRVMLVGASHWHAPLYRQALSRLSARVQVVAVTDHDAEVARSMARAFGAEAADHPGSFASDMAIDLAIVLGRHDRMSADACFLIDRGIPIALEKPGALNLRELRAVRQRAERLAVPVAVPLVHRRAPFVDALRSVREPRYLSISYFAGSPSRYPDAGCGWMLDPAAGGGALTNFGPHFTDLVAWLARAPIVGVRAAGHRTLHSLKIEDHASLLLETAGGLSATVELGYVLPGSARHVSVSIAGAGGFVRVSPDGQVLHVDADGSASGATVSVDSDPLFGTFVDDLVDTLPRQFAGLPGLDDLVAAMTVVETAYRDIEEGPRLLQGTPSQMGTATWAT